MIIILSICILISFSNQSLSHKVFKFKAIDYLEKLSLPMYLNQYLIMQLITLVLTQNNISISYYVMVLLVVPLLMLLSFIIEQLLLPLYYKIVKLLKKLFLETEKA